MNEIVKNVVIFASGVAAGGLAAYFFMKKPLEKSYKKKKEAFDKEIAEMDAYISKLRGQKEAESLAEESGYVENPVKSAKNESEITENPVKSAKNEQKDDRIYPKKTDYAAIYRQKIASEHPRDDDPEEEKRINSSRKINEIANSERLPEVITSEEYRVGHEGFEDSRTLNYYIYDNILTNEENEIIPKRKLFLGNLIEETGFDDNDEDVLYVRNYKLLTDYEVDKVYEKYDEEDRIFFSNRN